jgi:TRAP-type C4-dicarboxylate transport system permease small subunit
MAGEAGIPAAPIESLASEQAAVAAVTAAPPIARFARLDHILALATEIPAAVLVTIEILVLLAGVVSRYVFNQPLTWTDELASILFLWLAMLGAVIALRRDEHMRLGVLIARAPPRWRPSPP